MIEDRIGPTTRESDGEKFGLLADARSLRLAKSTYSGQAILATIAQYSSVLVASVSEDAYNYEVAVDLIDRSCTLDRVIGDFLRELTDQQVRMDVERRFGITRDILVRAAFESRENV